MKSARELVAGKKSAPKIQEAAVLRDAIRRTGHVLGLFEAEPKSATRDLKLRLLPELGITEAEIEAAITRRAEARSARDFAAADAARGELLTRGIELRDGTQGTEWSIKYQE
jgi:cysteinyl-tRNA synthetase